MYMYKRDRHTAVVDGPLYAFSTHYERTSDGERGIRVRLFRVLVDGQAVYHAPIRQLCQQWLVLHRYFPHDKVDP